MNSPLPAGKRLLERLDGLAAALQAEPEALGLLALGSVGEQTQRLDDDEEVQVRPGVEPAAKPRFVADLSWLAAAHPLAWHFRNTADGHKALMADGVLCEFAVFAPAELRTVPYAPGRWVWRREGLDAAGAQPAVPLPAPRDRAWLVGEALSNLLVGLMRHARGERLAAMRLVQVYALDRVLELAARAEPPPPGAAAADPFSPERRAEARLPALAAQLPQLAGGYAHTVPAARALLAWLQAQQGVSAAVAARIEVLAVACEAAGAAEGDADVGAAGEAAADATGTGHVAPG
jgi:hypothetical protein